MQYRIFSFLVSVLIIVSMAACGQKPEATPQGTADRTEPVPVPDGVITVEPRELTSCDIGSAVKISWNLAIEHPTVSDAEIWVGSNDSTLNLFAAVGPFGESTTGPWAAPGTLIVVRDKANGTELGRVVIGGPVCAAT